MACCLQRSPVLFANRTLAADQPSEVKLSDAGQGAVSQARSKGRGATNASVLVSLKWPCRLKGLDEFLKTAPLLESLHCALFLPMAAWKFSKRMPSQSPVVCLLGLSCSLNSARKPPAMSRNTTLGCQVLAVTASKVFPSIGLALLPGRQRIRLEYANALCL